MIRSRSGDHIKRINAVGAYMVLFAEMRGSVCCNTLGSQHIQWAMGLIARMTLSQRAATAMVATASVTHCAGAGVGWAVMVTADAVTQYTGPSRARMLSACGSRDLR